MTVLEPSRTDFESNWARSRFERADWGTRKSGVVLMFVRTDGPSIKRSIVERSTDKPSNRDARTYPESKAKSSSYRCIIVHFLKLQCPVVTRATSTFSLLVALKRGLAENLFRFVAFWHICGF